MQVKREKTVLWKTSSGPVEYPDALKEMDLLVENVLEKNEEMVWFLEHPSLYTIGSSGKETDILDPSVPSYKTGRGGQVTYHGPGQRVIYVMLHLKNRTPDVRAYVAHLEEWIIKSLQKVGIQAFTRPNRVGLWVFHEGQEKKIAAIGVRIRKWVTYHGIALNVDPDLTLFKGIVPCGLSSFGVTSLKEMGVPLSLEEMDEILKKTWSEVF